MKLLILTQKVDVTDSNLGFFHQWIEEFAKKCEQVIVVCLFEGKHDLAGNVRVLSLGKESGTSRMRYLRRFYSYIWKERGNYDAVFVHMNQIYVILGGLIWRALGKRIGLWYAHGSTPFSLRFAALLAHDIFTSTIQSFRIRSPKVRVIGHGIDTESFSYIARERKPAPILVSWGRISPVKDYETLIEAVALLRAQGILARARLIGSPGTPEQEKYLQNLKKYAAMKGLEEAVVFPGPVSHQKLPGVLADVDMFVHTSQTGSLDKAPLEAMATGLPVFTCNESVRSVLPPAARDMFSFASHDASMLAEEIRSFALCAEEERIALSKLFREVVREGHRLEGCIIHIMAALAEKE
jgi:glycosyltransferase involved in cell wall biosynthesis